jgi:hypothetical protein
VVPSDEIKLAEFNRTHCSCELFLEWEERGDKSPYKIRILEDGNIFLDGIFDPISVKYSNPLRLYEILLELFKD